jgi:hypothetical protein
MEKLMKFILCAVAVVIGVAGSIVECNRIIGYPISMNNNQLVGEIGLIAVYGGMAILAAVCLVRLWNQKY